ncbi:MAG TPA: hypothetical protein VGV06_07710 [Methylomirabilota bacterium]|nr:hypothetical protein [Methylomirabilota bacterium]
MCATRTSSGKTLAPRWGRLYLLATLALGLSGAAETALQARPWHTVMESVVVGAIFGTMAAWVRANRAALDQADCCDCAADRVTVRVLHSRSAARYVMRDPEPGPLRLYLTGLGGIDTGERETAECSATSDRP